MHESERKNNLAIAEKIREQVAKLLPDFKLGSWGGRNESISIHFSSPRLMWRSSAGKANWTIDLSEGVTYSRKRQVRVKVLPDGRVEFDGKKLLEHFAALQHIIQKDREKVAALEQKKSALPYLPKHLEAKPFGERYHVKYDAYLSLEQTKRLAEVLAAFNAEIESQKP